MLDPTLLDAEGGHVFVDGKMWEDIDSGKAIVAKYGKKHPKLTTLQFGTK